MVLAFATVFSADAVALAWGGRMAGASESSFTVCTGTRCGLCSMLAAVLWPLISPYFSAFNLKHFLELSFSLPSDIFTPLHF